MALSANQIWQCLDLDLSDGSESSAEQLVAHEDSAETRYSHAYVSSRRRQFESVKLSAEPFSAHHVGCAWVYAMACLRLGQHEDGVRVLTSSKHSWASGNDLPSNVSYGRGELSSAGFHLLLAKSYEQTNPTAAQPEYIESTRSNPYLIENVLASCNSTTAEVKSKNLFSRYPNNPFEWEAPAHTRPANAAPTTTGTHAAATPANAEEGHTTSNANMTSFPEDEASAPTSSVGGVIPTISGSILGGAPISQQASTSTPRRIVTPQRALTTPLTFSPAIPASKFPVQKSACQTPNYHTPNNQINPFSQQQQQQQQTQSQWLPQHLTQHPNQHPNHHLTQNPSPSHDQGQDPNSVNVQTNHVNFQQPPPTQQQQQQQQQQQPQLGGAFSTHRGPIRERFPSLSFRRGDQSSFQSLGRGLFGNAAETFASSGNATLFGAAAANVGSAVGTLTGLAALEAIVDALESLSQSAFTEALACISNLATSIQQTPFVLALKGKLLLEQGQNDACAQTFEKLRKSQPDRVRGMESMSTASWHSNNDAKSSLLGFELTHHTALTRKCWQSWCVLGNALSLRHDTSNAIKCFRRSIQIEPTVFAWTLLGYEYMANDELENAVEAFSASSKSSPQHYNAWYGSGSAYYSLGDTQGAEAYFSQALRSNPNNSVLYCFMGAVLAERGQIHQALAQYDRASQLDPRAAMPKFRKAEISMELGKHPEALKSSSEVEQAAPEDASIQMTLARVYKRLGEGEKAVQFFTKAHQSAPKSGTRIRKEIELV